MPKQHTARLSSSSIQVRPPSPSPTKKSNNTTANPNKKSPIDRLTSRYRSPRKNNKTKSPIGKLTSPQKSNKTTTGPKKKSPIGKLTSYFRSPRKTTTGPKKKSPIGKLTSSFRSPRKTTTNPKKKSPGNFIHIPWYNMTFLKFKEELNPELQMNYLTHHSKYKSTPKWKDLFRLTQKRTNQTNLTSTNRKQQRPVKSDALVNQVTIIDKPWSSLTEDDFNNSSEETRHALLEKHVQHFKDEQHRICEKRLF